MRLYTFSMPFTGTLEVWLEAESLEEAKALVANGEWDDSDERTRNEEYGSAELVNIEEYTDEEIEE